MAGAIWKNQKENVQQEQQITVWTEMQTENGSADR